MRRVISRIDAVHSVPALSAIAVVYTEETGFGRYVPQREGTPRHFELSRFGPHPALTMTHEVGHYLDHALGGFDVYLSRVNGSVLANVLKVAASSQAIRALRAYLLRSDLSRRDRFQIEYWLSPWEEWARAYAQYIAERSGDLELLHEMRISVHLEQRPYAPLVQWQTEDFQPIRTAIETAFRDLGWLIE